MGHQHRNEDNDEINLKEAFCRSNEQLRFNLDRIIQKYENMELSGKCSGVEIDLDGYVYYPVDMPRSKLDRTLNKLINRNENFGLSAFAAQENSAEIFGKHFKQRLKECRKLDAEFDQRFKSKHPYWRPYTTPRKSRVERTVIRKTVKELTFENSVDYLNYLMKVKHIPADVFKQQEIAYVNRMALPSTELEISQKSASPGRVARTIRSRSASPCTSTDSRNGTVTAPSSLMLLGDSCVRSRECSPVTSHPPNDGFPTTSQTKSAPSGPASPMFLTDSCNRSRDCSPSTSRLSDNDDFFASIAYQKSGASSIGASDLSHTEGSYQPSKTNEEAEPLFPPTNRIRRCGKEDTPVVWQEKEFHKAKEEEKKFMSPAEKRPHSLEKQGSADLKKDEKSPIVSNETTRVSTSIRKMESKSPFNRNNDVDSASESVIVDGNPSSKTGNYEQSSEVPLTNCSAATPSSKKGTTLTTVGSVSSKAITSVKNSRKRKPSHTPTAPKSRISPSQKKSPKANMECSTEVISPPKRVNPQATPKVLLSVDSNAGKSGKKSRKRKSSQTPAASKPRVSSSKKQLLEGSTGSTTEAVSLKKTKTQATPKTMMSADSSVGSEPGSRRNLSQSQSTPATSRLRTRRAGKQPYSSASTSLILKRGNSANKLRTPQAAESTVPSRNEASSFETPKIVKAHISTSSGSRSRKRTSKTPKDIESQPSESSRSKKGEKEQKAARKSPVKTVTNLNILAEKKPSTLTIRRQEISLQANSEASKSKKLVSTSSKVAMKAQRRLRSRRKAFTPGTAQKLSKKPNRSGTILKLKNCNGKKKSSAKLVNKVILENDTTEQSEKNEDPENASIVLLQSAPCHKSSPVPFNSQKVSASKKPGKGRSNDSDFERVVTPLNGEPVACDFWNGNVNSVVQSYDDNYMNFGKPTTILGFDAGDVRRNCQEDAQQSTLSAFLNCARKYSLSEAESVSVDEAMKEDRRAMAAARNRNRQLISGYYV